MKLLKLYHQEDAPMKICSTTQNSRRNHKVPQIQKANVPNIMDVGVSIYESTANFEIQLAFHLKR